VIAERLSAAVLRTTPLRTASVARGDSDSIVGVDRVPLGYGCDKVEV
jgi:hypothetical protein